MAVASYETAAWTAGNPVSGCSYSMAYTYQDSDRSYRLHVWDETNKERLGSAGSDVTGAWTNSINVEGAARYLGNRDGASLHLDGLLDEAIVFNDVLTADEIAKVREGTLEHQCLAKTFTRTRSRRNRERRSRCCFG